MGKRETAGSKTWGGYEIGYARHKAKGFDRSIEPYGNY